MDRSVSYAVSVSDLDGLAVSQGGAMVLAVDVGGKNAGHVSSLAVVGSSDRTPKYPPSLRSQIA